MLKYRHVYSRSTLRQKKCSKVIARVSELLLPLYGRSRHAVSYLRVTRAKNQTRLIFCPCCPSFWQIYCRCVDASVTAVAEERVTANQRAAFCFVRILLSLLL
jgi:hypothetical protein